MPKTKRRRWTKAQRQKRNEEIMRLYFEGELPIAEIGDRVGITGGGVWKVIARTREEGEKRPNRAKRTTPTKEQAKRQKRNERIRKLYDEGLSMEEVASRVGMTKAGVWRVFTEREWPTRSVGDSLRIQRDKRDQEIRAAFERVLAKKTDLHSEAKKLGITAETLRTNFRRRGLSLPKRVSPLHGTRYRYIMGCRCDECSYAAVEYQKRFWGREPPKHGTRNAYTNYGCRCKDCREAGSRINKQYYERRKVQSNA